MTGTPDLYSLLLDRVSQAPTATVQSVTLGLNWSLTRLENGACGLAFSSRELERDLPWPGTLAGQSVQSLAHWLTRWSAVEAVIGATAVNAALQQQAWPEARLSLAQHVPSDTPPHLAVFRYFAREFSNEMQDANIIVVGSYPGLNTLRDFPAYTCLERRSLPGTLPDTAAEHLLPQADWVFLTGSSIANKTAQRLLTLSREARVVLMGPSVPWLAEWQQFGVDFLAGVEVTDPDRLQQIVAEAGGTRIFGNAVHYCIHQF